MKPEEQRKAVEIITKAGLIKNPLEIREEVREGAVRSSLNFIRTWAEKIEIFETTRLVLQLIDKDNFTRKEGAVLIEAIKMDLEVKEGES